MSMTSSMALAMAMGRQSDRQQDRRTQRDEKRREEKRGEEKCGGVDGNALSSLRSRSAECGCPGKAMLEGQ